MRRKNDRRVEIAHTLFSAYLRRLKQVPQTRHLLNRMTVMTTEPTPFEKFREFTKMFPFPNPKSTSAKNTIKRIKIENGEQPELKINQRNMAYAVRENG